jgi:hypothetical protein
MERIRRLRFFRRPDQHEVQVRQQIPAVDEPEVQQSLKPASSVKRNTRAIPQDVKIEVAVGTAADAASAAQTRSCTSIM